jgi:hypothetical protein
MGAAGGVVAAGGGVACGIRLFFEKNGFYTISENSAKRLYTSSFVLYPPQQMPPSRQERRKAERDAAKRAPVQAGAASANPRGDWTTQTDDPRVLLRALGAEALQRRAGEGDRDAQYSLVGRCRLTVSKTELKARLISALETKIHKLLSSLLSN